MSTLFAGEVKLERHSQFAAARPEVKERLRALPNPPGPRLLELVRSLENELSEPVRDKMIVLPKSPGGVRVAQARAYDVKSGETSLAPFTNPKNERELEGHRPLPTAKIIDDVLEYASEVIAWVRSNLGR